MGNVYSGVVRASLYRIFMSERPTQGLLGVSVRGVRDGR